MGPGGFEAQALVVAGGDQQRGRVDAHAIDTEQLGAVSLSSGVIMASRLAISASRSATR